MTRHVFDGPDSLLAAVGMTLGPSSERTLDQAAVDLFADLTDDRQWIHVDPERAASGPFGRTVVHGFFTLSLCSSILDELEQTTGFAHALNYGLEKVRFPAALPVGVPVVGTVTLAAADARPDGVQAVWRIELSEPGAPKPVCVAEMVSRYVL